MNWLLKLAVPIGLGIVATVLNFMAGATSQKPVYFVAAKTDIAAGTPFSDDVLISIPVPSSAVGTLKGAAFTYDERAVLLGRPCPRELKKGEIIFYQDASPKEPELDLHADEVAEFLSLEGITNNLPKVLKVGDKIGFYVPVAPPTDGKGDPLKAGKMEIEYIGPFRIVSIGGRITRDVSGKMSAATGETREIGFAVKKTGDRLDEKVKRLFEARLAQSAGGGQVVVEIYKMQTSKK